MAWNRKVGPAMANFDWRLTHMRRWGFIPSAALAAALFATNLAFTPAFAHAPRTQGGATTLDITGTYARPVGGDFEILEPSPGRFIMRVQGLPDYSFQPIDATSFRIGPPAFAGSTARFGPGSVIPNTIEMLLKMGDTAVIAPRRTSSELERDGAEYKDLIGHYRAVEARKELPLDGKMEISNIGGHLALLISHQPAYPLIPISRDVLELGGLTPKGAFVLSVRRDGGRIAGFSLKQPNGTFDYVAAEAAEALTVGQLRLKIIEAIGGAAALKAKRTLSEAGEIEHQSGMSGSARSRWKAPLLVSSDVTMRAPGGKTSVGSRSVSDAKRGVTFEKGKPPKAMSALALSWAMLDTPQEPLSWDTLYKSVTLLGQRRYNDMDCYVVAKTLRSGHVLTEYYAVATFLSAGVEGPNTLDSGQEVAQSVRKLDWRTVGGVKRSFTQIGTFAGYEFTLRLTSSQWNVELPDSAFAQR